MRACTSNTQYTGCFGHLSVTKWPGSERQTAYILHCIYNNDTSLHTVHYPLAGNLFTHTHTHTPHTLTLTLTLTEAFVVGMENKLPMEI